MSEIKTEFKVEVVQIAAIQEHPNADALELTLVNGYPVIVKKGEYQPGDTAVYIPVDSLVPLSRPEFRWLSPDADKTTYRIRARRLRGIFSMGLLIPAPAGLEPGQDVAELFGITKYVSKEEEAAEKAASRAEKVFAGRTADKVKLPVYGLDAFRRFSSVLKEGEEVVATEKIHGSNFRAVYTKGRLWVGSHKVMRGASRHFVKEWFDRAVLRVKKAFGIPIRPGAALSAADIWWEAAEKYDLRNRLAKHPNMVVYGEVYGEAVQDLTYDSPKGRRLRFFDVLNLKTGKYLDFTEFRKFICELGFSGDEMAPVVALGTWGPEMQRVLKDFSDNGVTIAGRGNHLTEGVVIKPTKERTDPTLGRVALKLVGEGYLLRKTG